jgi:hypothetical protein
VTREQTANRRALAKAVQDEQRRVRSKALDDIRGELARVHERRRHVLRLVAAHCRKARLSLAEKIKAHRAEVRLRLNAEVEAWRKEERARCGARRLAVGAGAASVAGKKREALRLERREQDILRRAERRRETLERKTHRKAEARRESDDEVRGNVGPELAPIFDAVRSRIRGGPGRSRTEAFLQWVEENEGEVWAIRERESQGKVRALLAEERRAHAALKKCSGGKCGKAAGWHPLAMVRELRKQGHSFAKARGVADRVAEEIALGDRRAPDAIAAEVLHRWHGELAAVPF